MFTNGNLAKADYRRQRRRTIGRDPRNLRRSLKSGELARARILRSVLKLTADKENAAMRAKLKEQANADH